MGTWFEFSCNECEYTITASDGRDVGMIAVVKTKICLDCAEIVDVLIGSQGRDGPTGDPEFDKDLDICPECEGSNLRVWPANHPCPKCAGKMIMDENSMQLWD